MSFDEEDLRMHGERVELLLRIQTGALEERLVGLILDTLTPAERTAILASLAKRLESQVNTAADRVVEAKARGWIEAEATAVATKTWAIHKADITAKVETAIAKWLTAEYVGQIVDLVAPKEVKAIITEQWNAIRQAVRR